MTQNIKKFHSKKLLSSMLSEFYVSIAGDKSLPVPYPEFWLNRAMRVRDCGNYLEFQGDDLVSASFCRDRLCPMCSWRKSLKMFSILSSVLDGFEVSFPAVRDYVFITLTVRNCVPSDLSRTLDIIYDGWRLFNRGLDKKSPLPFVGIFRALEVTYNDITGTCHPHFHLLCACPPDYFVNDTLYMSQRDLCERWRVSCALDYVPICDIRKIHSNPNRSEDSELNLAIAEVSKYVTKGSDLISSGDHRLIYYVADALRSRRVYNFAGKFYNVHRALGSLDPETCSLSDRDSIRDDVSEVVALYWNGSSYQIGEIYREEHNPFFVSQLQKPKMAQKK